MAALRTAGRLATSLVAVENDEVIGHAASAQGGLVQYSPEFAGLGIQRKPDRATPVTGLSRPAYTRHNRPTERRLGREGKERTP